MSFFPVNKSFKLLLISGFLSLLTIQLTSANETKSDSNNDSKRLSNAELKSFYSGKTMIARHHEFGPLNVYFDPSGRGEIGKFHLKGSWWVNAKDNNLCIKVDVNKKTFCHFTQSNDDGTHTIVHQSNGQRLVEIKSALKGNKLDLDLTAAK